MIALLVSGEQDEYALIKDTLVQNGYGCIQYINFLKAYDNLDEVCPDLIIINAQEYPRHWKIIAFAAKKTRTILLVPKSFNSSAEAKELSVSTFLYDDDIEFNKQLFNELLNSTYIPDSENDTTAHIDTAIDYSGYCDDDDFSAPTVEELLSHSGDDYISTGSNCSFVFMNPAVMSIITGKVISFVYPEICFLPDRKEGFQSVYIGQIFDDCSLKTEIGLSSVKTCVTDVSDTITLHIC